MLETQEPASDTNEHAWPYRVRDDFLSPAELSFYQVLKHAVEGQYTICPKVSLGDVFFVTRSQENVGFLNRISRKHVDFLLCDPQTLIPALGVELDDSSHQAARREARDRLVEQVFEVAGLPLLRIPVQPSYAVSKLQAAVYGVRSTQSSSRLAQPRDLTSVIYSEEPPLPQTTPSCPKCGVPMLLRTAKQGNRLGQPFYGCPNYPKCREIVNVVSQDV